MTKEINGFLIVGERVPVLIVQRGQELNAGFFVVVDVGVFVFVLVHGHLLLVTIAGFLAVVGDLFVVIGVLLVVFCVVCLTALLVVCVTVVATVVLCVDVVVRFTFFFLHSTNRLSSVRYNCL